MRIDFDQIIRSLKGLPLTLGDETLTLKFVAITALLNTFPDEGPVEGAEKARRYRLAKGIDAGLDQVEAADCELIKSLVGKTFGPPVVGPVFDAFQEQAGDETLEKAVTAVMKDRAEAGLDELPKRKRGRA